MGRGERRGAGTPGALGGKGGAKEKKHQPPRREERCHSSGYPQQGGGEGQACDQEKDPQIRIIDGCGQAPCTLRRGIAHRDREGTGKEYTCGSGGVSALVRE